MVVVVYGCCAPGGGVEQDRVECCRGKAYPSALLWDHPFLYSCPCISSFQRLFFFSASLGLSLSLDLAFSAIKNLQPPTLLPTSLVLLSLICSYSPPFLYVPRGTQIAAKCQKILPHPKIKWKSSIKMWMWWLVIKWLISWQLSSLPLLSPSGFAVHSHSSASAIRVNSSRQGIVFCLFNVLICFKHYLNGNSESIRHRIASLPTVLRP